MDDGKRKFLRVNYPCSIIVWREDGSSEVIMANTANISVGGLCVYFDEQILLQTQVEVKIENFFEGNPLRCRGKVVRCKPDTSRQSQRRKYYEIGIEFLDINEKQREYLTGFVERLLALEAKKKS